MIQSVLVIESEPWLGDHYQRNLEKNGFEVSRATNAYTAIDVIDDNPPVVIIMSLLLSGAVGIGLLHELQSYVDTAKIPVIICTSPVTVDLDDLRPYGVERLIDSSTMRPNDITAAVRSVLA